MRIQTLILIIVSLMLLFTSVALMVITSPEKSPIGYEIENESDTYKIRVIYENAIDQYIYFPNTSIEKVIEVKKQLDSTLQK